VSTVAALPTSLSSSIGSFTPCAALHTTWHAHATLPKRQLHSSRRPAPNVARPCRTTRRPSRGLSGRPPQTPRRPRPQVLPRRYPRCLPTGRREDSFGRPPRGLSGSSRMRTASPPAASLPAPQAAARPPPASSGTRSLRQRHERYRAKTDGRG